MTLRSRYALRGLHAGWLLAAGTLGSIAPTAVAADSFEAPTTLAPRVAPATSPLDVTISSMVKRGILPDVRPAHSGSTATNGAAPAVAGPALTPAPQSSADKPLADGPGQWRPAGTSQQQENKAAQEAFSEPAFPSLPNAAASGDAGVIDAGDFDSPGGRLVYVAMHDGDGPFIVSLVDPDGAEEIVIEEDGVFDGRTRFRTAEGPWSILVDASGPWTLEVRQAS